MRRRRRSPPIELGLELGREPGHIPIGSEFTKSYGFNVFQLQESQLQSLIYKYIEAGLPIPNHLLLLTIFFGSVWFRVNKEEEEYSLWKRLFLF